MKMLLLNELVYFVFYQSFIYSISLYEKLSSKFDRNVFSNLHLRICQAIIWTNDDPVHKTTVGIFVA